MKGGGGGGSCEGKEGAGLRTLGLGLQEVHGRWDPRPGSRKPNWLDPCYTAGDREPCLSKPVPKPWAMPPAALRRQ